MSSVLPRLVLIAFVISLVSACNLDLSDLEFDLGFGGPELRDVPGRLALGTSAVAEVLVPGPDTTVTAGNPDVLGVERIGSELVELTAVEIGQTSLFVEGDGRRREYSVEVAAHERYEVLLVERAPFSWRPVAVVTPQRIALLAGAPQRIVVVYYDSQGLLLGRGLADFAAPPRSDECEAQVAGPFDVVCLVLERGLHVVRFDVAGKQDGLVIGAVPKEDIVDLLLLRTEEERAAAGDIIRVIAVGLSAQGTRVYGVGAEFGSPGVESMAYEYDPNAAARQISVKAAGFEEELTYRGYLVSPEPLWRGCGGWLGGCRQTDED